MSGRTASFRRFNASTCTQRREGHGLRWRREGARRGQGGFLVGGRGRDVGCAGFSPGDAPPAPPLLVCSGLAAVRTCASVSVVCARLRPPPTGRTGASTITASSSTAGSDAPPGVTPDTTPTPRPGRATILDQASPDSLGPAAHAGPVTADGPATADEQPRVGPAAPRAGGKGAAPISSSISAVSTASRDVSAES
eukprot:scaffold2639_cov95-Isochrysis_galbana.AAC.1